MEEYTTNLNTDTKPLFLGWNVDQVLQIHKKSYGDNGSKRIFENSEQNYKIALNQYKNSSNHNLLMVGKVQSGKTSNLEMFTAFAFDNDFNVVVIYGGYDSWLLGQTARRFKKTFDVQNDIYDDAPLLFSTGDDSSDITDSDLLNDALNEGKKLILLAMKRPKALEKINETLKDINKSNMKCFVIDDEGDQASINIAKGMNKKDIEKASATYKSICRMKNILNNPLYLSVTATPQANIFLDQYSELIPGNIILAPSGEGYLGTEAFHSNLDHICLVNDVDADENKGYGNESLKNAVCHFLLSSAIMELREGIKKSDMIIHAYREVSLHDVVSSYVNSLIEVYKEEVTVKKGISSLRFDLERIFTEEFFATDVLSEFSCNDLYEFIVSKIIKKTYVVIRNSTGTSSSITSDSKLRPHQIHIGGDLLQRGITFDRLVTTYFTRWAKKGNMDTSLQRARWFGYRIQYFDLCKIFTTSKIADEFVGLGEMEADLWDQFEMIKDGKISVSDINILADGTSLNPTSKQKVEYTSVAFNTKWYNQRFGVFDKNIIQKNNSIVDQILNELDLKETSIGRRDGCTSAHFSYLSSDELFKLINDISDIFDLHPFDKLKQLDLSKYKKIVIENLTYNDGEYRERQFIDGKVSYLKQGANTSIEDKINYEGDSKVIVDNDAMTIQISKVQPKEYDKDFSQYMFAIHFPYKSTSFIRS